MYDVGGKRILNWWPATGRAIDRTGFHGYAETSDDALDLASTARAGTVTEDKSPLLPSGYVGNPDAANCVSETPPWDE